MNMHCVVRSCGACGEGVAVSVCVVVQGMGAALACERAECAPGDGGSEQQKRLGRYEDDTPTYRAFTKLWSDHRPVVVAIPTSLLLQV